MVWYYVASLTPAALLACACLFGGIFPALALLSITVFVFVMDRLVASLLPETPGPGRTALPAVLAVVHGLLWVMGILAIGTGAHLDSIDKLLILAGLGLFFGQVSNSNAHELIHRSARGARRLGVAVYCSLLFGHHSSTHTRVHHIHAATVEDPNTARLGEGFWRYLLRAWTAGFLAGKLAEDALRGRSTTPPSPLSHPYVSYVAGSLASIVAAWMLAGPGGIAALLALAGYAQLQLYLSDYVQHYGLLRAETASGKVEPMGPAHSWNAPHWYSGAMMLNAPRHSDHHTNPSKPFEDLALNEDAMPMLPHSLPVMAVVALFPPVWRRIMDHRARAWAAPGLRMAAQ